jgi:membrane-associated phospholipid phosphatase
MFIAAVYLDHHWILDALAGWTVAIVAVCAARRLLGNSTLASSVSADSDAARLVGPESP